MIGKKQGQTLKVQRTLGRKRYLVVGVIAGMAVAAGGYWALPDRSPIPKQYVQQATYPLYYPTNLPREASVKMDSYRQPPDAPEVLLYTIQWGNKAVSVSLQPKPEGYNFAEFEQQRLSGARAVITPSGKGIVGRGEGKVIGSLVTETTWILVTGPGDFSFDDMDRLLSGLKKQ